MVDISKMVSNHNLRNFDYMETKKNLNNYFMNLEILEWELAKMNARRGLSMQFNFEDEYRKYPYSPIGKDMFNLSAIDNKEEQLKEFISSYFWAKNSVSEKERLYIVESFASKKSDDEIVELLGMNSSDSNEFRKLKRSALYKFADFLKLLVEKQ